MIIRDEFDALPGGQTVAALRSRILLGALADAEAERLGLRASPQQLGGTTQWFREQFDMPMRADVEDFLAFAGLDLAAFSAQMRTFTNIALIEPAHQAEVDRRWPSYAALQRLGEDR